MLTLDPIEGIVAYENKMVRGHNVLVAPGSIHMVSDSVPVFINFNFSAGPIGYADKFNRTEDGEIKVTMHLMTEYVQIWKDLVERKGGWFPTIYLTNIELKQHNGDAPVLKHGHLRGISLIQGEPVWIDP